MQPQLLPPAVAAVGPAASAATEYASQTSMPNVLVVDDDESMRDLLRLHLSNAGYAVTAAEDAVVALKCLLRRRPRLMIVDVNMPYMDGLDFVAAVKSDPAYENLPVMFLTAREDVDETARRLGAVACLRKPILANRLISAVEAVVPNGLIAIG